MHTYAAKFLINPSTGCSNEYSVFICRLWHKLLLITNYDINIQKDTLQLTKDDIKTLEYRPVQLGGLEGTGVVVQGTVWHGLIHRVR